MSACFDFCLFPRHHYVYYIFLFHLKNYWNSLHHFNSIFPYLSLYHSSQQYVLNVFDHQFMAFIDFYLFQECFSPASNFVFFNFYQDSFIYHFNHFFCSFKYCLKTFAVWFEPDGFIWFLQTFVRFSSINLRFLDLHYCLNPDFLNHSHLENNLHRNHQLLSAIDHLYRRRPLVISNFDSLFLIYFCR